MTTLSTDVAPLTGMVLNVQHFCTNDGPGIRTNVFLKGCSNRCAWCCNPESIRFKPELGYDLKKCIGETECGRCLKVCPEDALYVVEGDGKVRVNWDLCTSCGKCVPECPTKALFLYGKPMTVNEVLAEVEQDSAAFRDSGGGITLSGGECTAQPAFASALLAEAHQRGINTAIETAGNVKWEFFYQVLQHVDVVLHDHKLTDPERSKKWIGVDNKRILENYRRAYETFPHKTFIARTPVIPGVNDDDEHIRAVLAFIRPYPNVVDYELLPYHRYGEAKYGFLGRVYSMKDFPGVAPETLRRLRVIIDESFGRTDKSEGSTATGADRGAPP